MLLVPERGCPLDRDDRRGRDGGAARRGAAVGVRVRGRMRVGGARWLLVVRQTGRWRCCMRIHAGLGGRPARWLDGIGQLGFAVSGLGRSQCSAGAGMVPTMQERAEPMMRALQRRACRAPFCCVSMGGRRGGTQVRALESELREWLWASQCGPKKLIAPVRTKTTKNASRPLLLHTVVSRRPLRHESKTRPSQFTPLNCAI